LTTPLYKSGQAYFKTRRSANKAGSPLEDAQQLNEWTWLFRGKDIIEARLKDSSLSRC